ncbi:MAG: DUF1925 domain-containing protein [Treponema sp.]|jgi:hypothetical protein|nr:DUF1925 domain-containing protein [Treponema sp.]
MSVADTKINLVLGSHAHVPTGAEEHEFENVYEKVLRPFVSTLSKYPKIQAVLHYSGALLYWVERSRPELFMLIEDMVSRKQAELLGGGFYEPMLPLIPLQDRIGQIELLTTYLRKHFGKRPLGCWIPALAWEQHLVSPLAACGMTYTFLGENQFLLAGLGTEDLFAPCISEDQGKFITVFPVFQSAGAALAEKNVSVVLEELKSRLPPGGERIVSVFPEKLVSSEGESPDYTWNRFFEELSLCESLVECISPAKLLKGLKGLKKAAFPDSVGFIGSGENDIRVTPRRFLIEHPEANSIYSKMIFTSVLVNQLRGDKSRKLSAREELWKAHACDLFYPTGKSGPCRPSLRKAAYRSLIGAERITREKGKFSPSLIQFDFDFDGVGEYLFQDARLNCYIQPAGAGIFELDYLPKTWNYLDAGSFEEAGLPRRRTCFADYLLPAASDSDDLLRALTGPAPLPEGVRLCFTEKYEAEAGYRSRGKICFTLQAAALPFGNPLGNIEIKKCFSLKKDLLTVGYTLTNGGGERAAFRFVPEINLSFAGEGEEFVRFFICKSGTKDTPLGETGGAPISGAEGLKIQDLKNEVQIKFASTKPFESRLAPSRAGDQYQSSRFLPLFDLSLESGGSWSNEFSLRFSH